MIVLSKSIQIGTRGVDGTIPRTHQIDDRLFKYELNGFDLREINKTHDMLQTPVALNDLKAWIVTI